MKKMIYAVAMKRSKKLLVEKYSRDFWSRFQTISNVTFRQVIPLVPDIGDSIFSFNYDFGPTYIAWYKAFEKLGIPQQEIIENIWLMNERLVTVIPKAFLKATGKAYMGSFRREAEKHLQKQQCGGCHKYDWKIDYRDIDTNSFSIDIKECGLKKLAHDFGADGLLPGICRMDYLFAYYMGNGFVRTKTLGDGDDCCNGYYELVGNCEWAPEKGFIDRK